VLANDPKAVEALLTAGANPLAENDTAKLPVDYADRNNTALVLLLQKHMEMVR